MTRELVKIVLLIGVVAFLGWYTTSPRDCSTDAECAALPPCVLTPGCDGGPDPAHQPSRWLP